MFENLQYRHFLFFERPDFDVSPYKYTFQTMSIYEYLLCAHQECLGLASSSPSSLNIKVIPPANCCSFVLSCVSRAYVIYIITSPNSCFNESGTGAPVSHPKQASKLGIVTYICRCPGGFSLDRPISSGI